MIIQKKTIKYEIGNQFLETISISGKRLNTLFAALLLTSVGVFLGGNLLLWNVSILQMTTSVTLTSFAFLLIFYSLARVLNSLAWGLVLTYSLMLSSVYLRWDWLVPLAYFLMLCGFVYAVRFLRFDRHELVNVLLMGVLATLTILCAPGGIAFDVWHLLRVGSVDKDMLFHASIAAMIKNYGVTSTGLNGLIETPYYVISHYLMASISVFSRVDVFEIYGVAKFVMFEPILIFSIVAFVVSLDKNKTFNVPLAWGVTCVLLLITPWLLVKWGVDTSFFASESYLVSLGLFLIGLSLLFKRVLSVTDLLLVTILAAHITNAKASTGMIFAGLWIIKLIVQRGQRISYNWLASALVLALTFYMSFDITKANAPTQIVPFDFIVRYSFLGSYVGETIKNMQLGFSYLSWGSVILAIVAFFSFFMLHFLFSWIVIANAALKEGMYSSLKMPMVAYSLASVAAGVLIIGLFRIPGGSAGYFSNVSFFVSLPVIVVLLSKGYDNNFNTRIKRIFSTKMLLGITSALLFVLNFQYFYNAANFRRTLSGYNAPYLDSLIALQLHSPINVVIQPNITELQQSHNYVTECAARPFLFPAISERPWVNVIEGNCIYMYYGYELYGLTAKQNDVTVPRKLMPGMEEFSWTSHH